jgi:hypothetical protein
VQHYSSGSILMIAAPWLLPTQKVSRLVELSTVIRRMLVVRGRRYRKASYEDLPHSRDSR